MEADFAGDFAFRDAGSRFSVLKSLHTEPGPDECWGAFCRDPRLLFRKLLGLEVLYEGPAPDRRKYAAVYNSVNYYRSHLEEYFCHNGIQPVPPVQGECLMWFAGPDDLRVRYRLRNRADVPIPLRLRWHAEGEPGRSPEARGLPDGFEFCHGWEVTRVPYRARARLIADGAPLAFAARETRFESEWRSDTLAAGGTLEYRFRVAFAFNDEPYPAPPADAEAGAGPEAAIGLAETAYARLPRLRPPFDRHEALVLKAAGTLRSLRFRDFDAGGRPVMTIHAGKTGVAATWFWDTAFTLLGLGVARDAETAEGAIRLLADGITAGGVPPCTYEYQSYTYRYQMPILAWGVGHYLHHCPNDRLLADVYPALSRYANKWLEFRTPSGLVVHPPGGTALDDTLRWHTGFPLSPAPGRPWHEQDWGAARAEAFEAPDVNSFLYLDLVTLARMAAKLGRREDARTWESRAVALADAINRCLYDPALGIYQDRHVPTGRFTGFISNAAFQPLYAGIVPPDRAERLCRDWLLNPAHFLTPFPFPMVAVSQPTFRAGGFLYAPPEYPGALCQQAYAYGRSEVFMDFWFLGGLYHAGRRAEADALALRILDEVARHEAINECYDSLTGFGNGHPEFMWSSAGVLAIAAEYYKQPPVAPL
jgi:hypothetical protein